MNLRAIFLFPFFGLPLLLAQSPQSSQPGVPVAQAYPVPPPVMPAPGTQRVYGPSSDTLVARPTAEGILAGFRKVYSASAAPRVVIYVNRALIDTSTGMKLTGQTENYEKTDTSTKTTGQNTYAMKDGTAPTLADQQTVRDIERLFGRAFRGAGAVLADQKTAVALLADNPGHRLVGDQAAKDREALGNIADIAIEVLISSRNLTVPEVGGDKTYAVPDIQATAIRLKDSVIVGQAAGSDILGKDLQAGRIIRQFNVADITEATALALMEDMATGAAAK